jgi:hypothetical protein
LKNKSIKLWSIAVLLICVLTLSIFASFIIIPQNAVFKPYYMQFFGTSSRIYLASESLTYSTLNSSSYASDGSLVPEGTRLLVATITLRNDYSSDNPPPPQSAPVAPIDGTAYICLKMTARYADGKVANLINLTPSDFNSPSSNEIALILASGQTSKVGAYFATEKVSVSDLEINLDFLGDSAPI